MKELNVENVKCENRFVVDFPERFKISSYCIRSVDLPKFYGGEWESISIGFWDVVSNNSVTKGLNKIIKYNKPFTIKIKYLNGAGNILEFWEILVGKFNIDFGNLDWESKEILSPRIELKPVKCILK